MFVQVLEGREFEASEAVSIKVGAYSWGELYEHTPAEIQMAARLGIASNIWNVGDWTSRIPISKFAVGGYRKLVPSTNGYSYKYFNRYIRADQLDGSEDIYHMAPRAYVLGFDHNSQYEGNNTIHFMLDVFAFTDSSYGNSYSASEYKNSDTSWCSLHHRDSNTNKGGWEKSVIRTKLFPKLFDHFPDDWRNAIHNSQWNYKYTASAIGDVVDITGTNGDFFFLLSEYEVFGKITYSHPDEILMQEQYDYFRNGAMTVWSAYNDPSGKWINCWLRSPKYGDDARYCTVAGESSSVASQGDPAYAKAKTSLGIVPCFVIC